MNIEAEVHDFLHSNSDTKGRYILALSGGRDSMTLLFACKLLRIDVVAAHCNFELRGAESDEEEAFVKAYCMQNDIKLHTTRFNTLKVSQTNHHSIQETARALRYDWLEEIRVKEKAAYILTAHHGDDQAETMLFQLSRGSGIKGLRGIPPRNGHILRPMLGITGQQIAEYAVLHKIPYRNDSSNQKDNYSRNYIRHHIVPAFNKLNPQFVSHMIHTAAIAAEYEVLLQQTANRLREQYIEENNGYISIELSNISPLGYYKSILFNWLLPFGLNTAQVNDIAHSAHISGKCWESSTHRITFDRNRLLITPRGSAPKTPIVMDSAVANTFELNDKTWHITILNSPPVEFAPDHVYLDLQKLVFPIVLRNWEEGDLFVPLGMNNKKKLSDFFIDNKVSKIEKDKALVVQTATGHIAAVAPMRPDNRYKVTSQTQEVLVIALEQP